MVRILTCTLLVLFFTTLASAQRITGSGNMTEREFDNTGFTELSLSHAVEADIKQGSEYAVTVVADDNIMEHVDIDQRGDMLRIGMDSGRNYNDVTVRVTITMPHLTELRSSGAARVGAQGFNEDRLKLNCSGASRVRMQNSTVEELDLTAAGASNLDLDDLTCKRADVKVAGASSVRVRVTEEIDGDISGASSVRNKGGGTSRNLRTSGASRFSGSY